MILRKDLITPNQFEAEQLTGISIKNISDAQRACDVLHDCGVPLILITSMIFHDESQAKPSTIAMFTSNRKYSEKEDKFTHDQYILHAPLIHGQFTGTGDICAALFLAWTANLSDDDSSEQLKASLEKLGGEIDGIHNHSSSAS